jgi:hypothetical protein
MTYSTHPAAVRTREWRKANPGANKAMRVRYRARHRESLAERQRARAEKSRDKELARVKAWQEANPERYAATQEAIQQRKMDAQEQKAGRVRPDVCEVCAEPSTRRLAFDHCHDKGHFRGWICHRCNLALGLVKDSPAILRKLADYLVEDAMRQPFDPSRYEY